MSCTLKIKLWWVVGDRGVHCSGKHLETWETVGEEMERRAREGGESWSLGERKGMG